jgi:hypothetical protein
VRVTRTRIKDTARPRESIIHALMFAETGVPILLGLFSDVNASVVLSAYTASGTGRCSCCCARTCTRPTWTPRGAVTPSPG